MANFINVTKVETIKKGEISIEIYRCQKQGTKRIFFYPMFEGKRLTSTLFGAKWEAEKLATSFLKQRATV